MGSTQSWRGTWWIAEEPETTRQGILYQDEEDRVTLELIGGFDPFVWVRVPGGNGYAAQAENRSVTMIHGTAEGKYFSLLYPVDTHTSGGVLGQDVTKQTWSPQRVLKGIHLESLDEVVFTRGHLRLEYLLEWSNRTTFSIATQEPASPSSAEQHGQSKTAAHYGQTRIRLRVGSHPFNVERSPAAGTRTVQSTERAVLDLDPEHPVSYDAFDMIQKDLQDLLTFCAYSPAASLEQSMTFETSPAHPGHADLPNEVEVMGPQIYRGELRSSEKPVHNYLITLTTIDFAELVPKWLELKEKARMGCNILFGLRYISQGYVGTRLLGIATAAENIHRALRPEKTPLTREQDTELRTKLREALNDEPEEVRAFVNSRLQNKQTYRERLLDLAAIPDGAAVDKLLTDRGEWAKMLKQSRNDLAHANERSTAGTDASPAFWLLEVTYALLHLVLMAELGLEGTAQRQALDHPRIDMARSQFQKILGGQAPD